MFIFKNAKEATYIKRLDVKDIIKTLTTEFTGLERTTHEIRSILESNKENKKELISKLKIKLPLFSSLANVEGKGRKIDKPSEITGFFMDIDPGGNNTPEALDKAWNALKNTALCTIAYRSPKRGIKLFINFLTPVKTKGEYANKYLRDVWAFETTKVMAKVLNVEADTTSNTAYYSFATFCDTDDIIINEKHSIDINNMLARGELEAPTQGENKQDVKETASAQGKEEKQKRDMLGAVIAFLKTVEVNYNDWLKLGYALFTELGDLEGLEAFKSVSVSGDGGKASAAGKWAEITKSAKYKLNVATIFYIAKSYGYTEAIGKRIVKQNESYKSSMYAYYMEKKQQEFEKHVQKKLAIYLDEFKTNESITVLSEALKETTLHLVKIVKRQKNTIDNVILNKKDFDIKDFLRADFNIFKQLNVSKFTQERFINGVKSALSDYCLNEEYTDILAHDLEPIRGEYFKDSIEAHKTIFTEQKFLNLIKNPVESNGHAYKVDYPSTCGDGTYKKLRGLIAFIFDYDTKTIEFIENFLCQYALEHRTANRVALILQGGRQGGKGTFVKLLDGFFRNIDNVTEYSDSNFNLSYKRAKIISFVEASTDKAKHQKDVFKTLQTKIKKECGSEHMRLEAKGVDSFHGNSKHYYIVETNELDFAALSDNLDTKEKTNQFVICTIKGASEKEAIHGKMYTQAQITEAFREIGNYIEYYLKPRYNTLISTYKDYRYGFPTPILKDMQKARERGMGYQVTEIFRAFKYAKENSKSDFVAEYVENNDILETVEDDKDTIKSTLDFMLDFEALHAFFSKNKLINKLIFERGNFALITRYTGEKTINARYLLDELQKITAHRAGDVTKTVVKYKGKSTRGVEIEQKVLNNVFSQFFSNSDTVIYKDNDGNEVEVKGKSLTKEKLAYLKENGYNKI